MEFKRQIYVKYAVELKMLDLTILVRPQVYFITNLMNEDVFNPTFIRFSWTSLVTFKYDYTSLHVKKWDKE